MTRDLDADLRRLTAVDHPGLVGMEDSVLIRIRERRPSEVAFGMPLISIAALGAIALGATAGSLSRSPAAASSLTPFGPTTPLAPSTLLAVDR